MARRGKRTAVEAALGGVSVVIGLVLASRPFIGHSLVLLTLVVGLAVLGLAEIAHATARTPARWLGGFILAAAVAVACWPAAPIALVSILVGTLLVAAGTLELVAAVLVKRRGAAATPGDVPAADFSVSLLSGVITLGLGVIAMLCVDGTRLPLVIALGIRLALVGSGLLVDLWYPPTGYGASTEHQRLIGRAVAVTVAITIFVVSFQIDQGRPEPSDFYRFPLAAGAKPGQLLRADRDPDNTQKIRLLYSTTDADAAVVTASAALYVPRVTSGAALPLVVWAHSEDSGIAPDCAPSVRGTSAGLAAVPRLLAAGYAVVAPDYIGMGAPGRSSFLVGKAEAHALLDAVRATAAVPGVRVASTVIWGYSQGGHAALWAGQEASGYAPELRLAGIAVQSPLADPGAVMDALVAHGRAGRLGSYLLESYSERYPQVRVSDYLSWAEQGVAEEQAARCGALGVGGRIWAAMVGASGQWRISPRSGALGAALAQNLADGAISVPVLIQQGADDTIVSEGLQRSAVAARCRAREAVDYRTYPGVGHDGPPAIDSAEFSDLLGWTSARFAVTPLPSRCG